MKNNFVKLAEAQKEQGSMYCGGLDIHPFGSLEKNLGIYGAVGSKRMEFEGNLGFYWQLVKILNDTSNETTKENLARLLASVESYVKTIIDILVLNCNIRIFKPQLSFYVQFGPIGLCLLSRIRRYIKNLEKRQGIRLITILDCKVNDIDTTQAASFTAYLGNLQNDWGIDYTPFDFDIINVTPWMGEDVLVLGKSGEEPGLGLKLIKEGKGIIVVNKSSNPSGPEYQEQLLAHFGITLQMLNVLNLDAISRHYELEDNGLSAIGLVVGSTHPCDGSIRKAFPTTTLLVPGFGAQGGKFEYVMPELIREEKWAGQGAIFSSSRGTMFPFLPKLGGSGNVADLENNLVKAVENFRRNEKAAFATDAVKALGIEYPFDKK
jgi:orotidine 5'-phosphate decarboxylase subfamily 2